MLLLCKSNIIVTLLKYSQSGKKNLEQARQKVVVLERLGLVQSNIRQIASSVKMWVSKNYGEDAVTSEAPIIKASKKTSSSQENNFCTYNHQTHC
jgi:hypothetical protein